MVLFGRLRQEDHKFEATGATQSQSPKNKNKKRGQLSIIAQSSKSQYLQTRPGGSRSLGVKRSALEIPQGLTLEKKKIGLGLRLGGRQYICLTGVKP